MAKYTITSEAKEELISIPGNILPKDSLAQIRNFPIRSILQGAKQELEPEEIGNLVYDEIANLQMDNFSDVGMRKTCDWAKFVQAEVVKKLKTLITLGD